MFMGYLGQPLKEIYCTQPFSVNWVGPGVYDHNPSGKHAGMDFRAKVGTKLYAPMSGQVFNVPTKGKGGFMLELKSRKEGLHLLFAHLSKYLCKQEQQVRKGQVIALTGDSGLGAAHLHFGVCPIHYKENGSGPYRTYYSNGYNGYVDPAKYLDPDIFLLPVDRKYGSSVPAMSELDWYKAHAYFFSVTKRLATKREKYALVYGCWDLRSVLDPAMFDVWSRMTKPQFLS